ncbi:MAG: DUF3857 domain-containing protein [Acidobacteriota bacterium]
MTLGRPRLRLVAFLVLVLVALAVPRATCAETLPGYPAIDRASTPSWVDPLTIDVDAEGADDEIDYLLISTQVQVPRQGAETVYSRYAYRIAERSALDWWSSWQIDLQPDYQTLRLHHLRIYRGDAWSDRLATVNASLLQRESELEQQVVDDTRTLSLVLADVRVGDIVDVAYSLTGDNPVFGSRLHQGITLGGQLPVARYHLRVAHPTSRPLAWRAHGGLPEPIEATGDGQRLLLWDLEDVPANEFEDDAPPRFVQWPFVELSEFDGWGDVVEWALPLYDLPPSPAVDALAEEILATLAADETRDTDDAWHRLLAARRFVQDEVRYFAAVMGLHSHTPHAPELVLERRWGDCKDKTFLLIQLLERLGIDAWPAFVDADMRAGIGAQLPAPSVFDHAIVAARVDDPSGVAQTVWIDPTLSLQGGGDPEGEGTPEALRDRLVVPRYGYALEIRPGVDALSAVQPQRGGAKRVFYRYDVPPFDADGNAGGLESLFAGLTEPTAPSLTAPPLTDDDSVRIRADADELSPEESGSEETADDEAGTSDDASSAPPESNWPPVAVTIRSTYLGAEAESVRSDLASTTPDELLQSYVDYYTSDIVHVAPTAPLEIVDDRAANALTIVERYSLTQLGTWRFEILPLLLSSELPYPEDGAAQRTLPFALPQVDVVETVELFTPGLDDWGAVTQREDNRWFDYSATSERVDLPGGRGLRITYALHTKPGDAADGTPRGEVAPEDLDTYRQAYDRTHAELGYGIPGDDVATFDDTWTALAFGALLAVLGLLALGALGLALWLWNTRTYASPRPTAAADAEFDTLVLDSLPLTDFTSPTGRARGVLACFGGVVVVLLAHLAVLTVGLVLVGTTALSTTFWNGFETTLNVFLALRILLIFATAVLFLRWQHRMLGNLPALGRPTTRSEIRTAMWVWFVPIFNLFAPVVAIYQAVVASRPLGGRSLRVLVGAWWTAWVLGSLYGSVINTVSAFADLGDPTRTFILLSAGDMLQIGLLSTSAGLAALLVFRLSQQQDLRIAQLRAAAAREQAHREQAAASEEPSAPSPKPPSSDLNRWLSQPPPPPPPTR